MATQEEERRAQGRRLQLARSHAGYESPTDVARRAKGINRETFTQHENGTRSLKNAADTYAVAFDVPAEWLVWGKNPPAWLTAAEIAATTTSESPRPPLTLLKGSEVGAPTGRRPAPAIGARPVARLIPVIGEVQAGIWKEATAVDLQLADRFDPAAVGPEVELLPLDVLGYERAALFALRVRGPSMNLHYVDGSYVVAAPAAEAGVRDGDHVVIQRNRAGLVETTVKELVVTPEGKAELWPRSDHPEHQVPLLLNPRESDQDRPMIIGVVVADYRRRTRPDRGFYLPEGHAE